MIDLIEQQRAQITRLCIRYQVRRLAIFGSAVSDDFNALDSDLDFAVEFAPLSPFEHSECYYGLSQALEELFQRSIDLVEYRPIRNPYFLRALVESQVMLYEAA
jgi:uncharacterized protein